MLLSTLVAPLTAALFSSSGKIGGHDFACTKCLCEGVDTDRNDVILPDAVEMWVAKKVFFSASS